MSNATIESPVAASQLFFAWSEQAEVGSAPSAAPKKSTVQPAKSPAATAQPAQSPSAEVAHTDASQQIGQQNSQQSVKRLVNPTTVNVPAVNRQSPAVAPTGHLTFTNDGRIARPVRIGSVMIKLLKRYGITDAEIAEGVASYARKHQQAWAS